jgi:hypothetical protein
MHIFGRHFAAAITRDENWCKTGAINKCIVYIFSAKGKIYHGNANFFNKQVLLENRKIYFL